MLNEAPVANTSSILFQFAGNVSKVIAPALITMMCATVTYPLAVRFVKRVFGLRGFYAIHLTIAPILALIHVNIFGVSHTLFRIKHLEREFDAVKSNLRTEREYDSYATVNALIRG